MNEVLGIQPEESAGEAELMNPYPNQNSSREIEIDDDESMEEEDKDEEIAEDDLEDKDKAVVEDGTEEIVDGRECTSEKISVENRDNEHGAPGATVANDQDHITRCSKFSRPYDHAKDFPETSQFSHYQSKNMEKTNQVHGRGPIIMTVQK